nr:cytoplasmic tRNA 2 thiolation protein 2 [Hymenolepis microstoma]
MNNIIITPILIIFLNNPIPWAGILKSIGCKFITMDNSVCIKCKGKNGPPVALIRKDLPPLCKTCFLAGCVHKFRSSFGKANIVKDKESVALGFTGGASSLAMLFLAKKCQEENRQLRFQPTLICLYDEYNPYPSEQELLMKQSGFEYHIVRTDQISSDLSLPDIDSSKRMPNSVLTATEEVTRWSRLDQLKTYTSKTLGFKYLMVGENASQLATNCLSGIAQARGGSIASELGFADTRYVDVTILRPMYTFLSKEVALFLRFCNLEPLIEPCLSTQHNLKYGPSANSIQRLTQDFISSLQFGGFPSTTTAILSSASKTLSDDIGTSCRCKICRAPMKPPRRNGATAEAAFEFSALISRNTKIDYASAQESSPSERSSDLCTCCLVNLTEINESL